PGPLEVLRGARRAVGPFRVLPDGEGPDGALGVRRHALGHVGDGLEFGGELHQTRPERGHAGAIEILVVVVARGVVLPPAAATVPEVLVLGELFTGRELRRR